MRPAQNIVQILLEAQPRFEGSPTEVYAPANIALVKYWGKRDTELNLPVTSSLSVSMGGHGTFACIEVAESPSLSIDGEIIAADDPKSVRMAAFLELFGGPYALTTRSTVPVGAGLASSASAFASVVDALAALHGWDISLAERSVLARLGSGSASRSVATGFVEWRAGERNDGMDSHAVLLDAKWPAFRLGLITVHDGPKPIGSREAMLRTVDTSPLYADWPAQVERDLATVKAAIADRDFATLGAAAEANAVAMHLSMHAAVPTVNYWLDASVAAMDRVRALRTDGVPVWFTMDAGPNLKLLFEAGTEGTIREAFPEMQVIAPFDT